MIELDRKHKVILDETLIPAGRGSVSPWYWICLIARLSARVRGGAIGGLRLAMCRTVVKSVTKAVITSDTTEWISGDKKRQMCNAIHWEAP